MSAPTFSPRRCRALFVKELRATFGQPLYYVIAAFFLLLAGYYFHSDLVFFVTFGFGQNIFGNFFQLMFVNLRFVLLLTVPLLTMRLLAEEKKLATVELLFTWPLSDLEIFVAKFGACLTAVLGLLALCAVNPVALYLVHPFPVAPFLVGCLGLILLAALFVAVGLFHSSLTDNQLVAAMGTFGVLVFLWVVSLNEAAASAGALQWLRRLSMFDHFEGFSLGVVEGKDLFYFGALTVIAGGATLGQLASRRWSRSETGWAIFAAVGLLVAFVFAEALVERVNRRWDFTPDQRHTLSPHAVRVLERVQGPVEIIAFTRSGDPNLPRVEDLLERMAAVSPHISARTVELDRHPALARELGVERFGTVVVRNGDTTRSASRPREHLVVGAVLEATRRAQPVVAFVRSDPRFSGLRSGVENAGYRAVDGLPAVLAHPDSSVAVLAGTVDPDPAVLERLDRWLALGARLLVLMDPGEQPRLEQWLAGWGIRPRRDRLGDADQRLSAGEVESMLALPPWADGSSQPTDAAGLVTWGLDRGVAVSDARSFETEADVVRLLITSASGRSSALTGDGPDRAGYWTVAAAREWASEGGGVARLLVVGDSDFATGNFLGLSANLSFLGNAFSWLVGEEALIGMRPAPRKPGRQEFLLTARDARRILIAGTGVAPSLCLLVAMGLWLRRRWSR